MREPLSVPTVNESQAEEEFFSAAEIAELRELAEEVASTQITAGPPGLPGYHY